MDTAAQTPAFAIGLNDPDSWVRGIDFSAPESDEYLWMVQRELDSVLGLTRNNESIAKIVWNGDVRFWKELFIDWDLYGKPTKKIKRPFVLYKSVFDDDDNFVRDVFVPRYIVLTRMEPEQYWMDWERSTKFYCPERQRWVPYRPTTPPENLYVWFATIAHHGGGCCQKAAEYGVSCYGQYADPMSFVAEARLIRKGMEAENLDKSSPFDSPDAVNRRIRERMNENYEDQAMKRYLKRASHILLEDPFLAVSDETLNKGASVKAIEAEAKERVSRGIDAYAKQLKQQTGVK
jgi:hypothetical protein